MPELPEVETVVRTLQRLIEGRRIERVSVSWPPVVGGEVQTFCDALKGQHFRRFDRRGKYLILGLDDRTLAVHLRMEGKFYVQLPCEPLSRHVHVIFDLDDGTQLRYHDTRKFGRMYLYEHQEDLHAYPCFANVGLDAFDERLTADVLYRRLHGRSITLKQALLDQSVIAGVGNIYADEICFALRLHPQTRVSRMRKKDFEALITEMRRILGGAVRAGGTTIRSYTSSLGVDGRFQLQLRVHAKKGERCPLCGEPIKKITVGGRGTYYCERCQKRR